MCRLKLRKAFREGIEAEVLDPRTGSAGQEAIIASVKKPGVLS